MSDIRRPEPAGPPAPARATERRRFLVTLLGLGAAGVVAADSATAKPVEDVLDGGRP
jgi:hypothetical protein